MLNFFNPFILSCVSYSTGLTNWKRSNWSKVAMKTEGFRRDRSYGQVLINRYV